MLSLQASGLMTVIPAISRDLRRSKPSIRSQPLKLLVQSRDGSASAGAMQPALIRVARVMPSCAVSGMASAQQQIRNVDSRFHGRHRLDPKYGYPFQGRGEGRGSPAGEASTIKRASQEERLERPVHDCWRMFSARGELGKETLDRSCWSAPRGMRANASLRRWCRALRRTLKALVSVASRSRIASGSAQDQRHAGRAKRPGGFNGCLGAVTAVSWRRAGRGG